MLYITYKLLTSFKGAENETPFGNDPGVMIHVVTETGKSKWSHIGNIQQLN